MNDNRRYDNDRSRESRARQDAYQEYLSLREHNEDRGSYVKDDPLYGSYIPNRSGNRRQHQSSQEFDSSGGFHTSVEDTPYGVSKMRQQRQSAAEGKKNVMIKRILPGSSTESIRKSMKMMI